MTDSLRGKSSALAARSPIPLILQGLVALLPRQGERWTREKMDEWLRLAELAFDVTYDYDDEERVTNAPL